MTNDRLSVSKARPLNPKEEQFAQLLAKGLAQAEALREVYPHTRKWKPDSVWERASKLAAKVAPRLAQLQERAADAAVLDAVEVMQEIKRIAFSDIGGICNADGTLKMPHELDAGTRAAVKSFKVTKDGIEYQFWDKNSALDKAARIRGLFELDNKQKADPLTALLEGLQGNVLGVSRAGDVDDGGAG